jgi:hypothetical protein
MVNMSNVDFTIDFESLGLFENSVLLSMGCSTMIEDTSKSNDDIFNIAIESGLYTKFDVKEQIKLGRKTCTDTMAWWKEQDSEDAKAVLKPSPLHDISPATAILNLHDYLKTNGFTKNSNLWGRGYVEPMWYFSICRDYDIPPVIKYWQFRDARTALMLNMYPEKYCKTIKPNGCIAHNALHDAAFLIIQMLDPLGEK